MNEGLLQFASIALVFLIMYFLIIRPQSKKQKELQKMREALKSGDAVIVSGGIHGKVSGINDDGTVKVKVDSSATLRVEKHSISAVNGVSAEAGK
jgi:preprotein translocase subunit YajC